MNRFFRPNPAPHRSARRLMLAALLMLLATLLAPAVLADTAAGAPGAAIAVNKNNKPASGGDYTAYPTLNASAVAPLVMLVISRDEQLFIKAYTDYTDLDGDGIIDTTYNNNFNYSGYFDSNLCYTYGTATYKASAAAAGLNNHQCNGSTWSGNFLNWLTMSRLDVLRLVLYGGYRSTDTATATTLERAPIPNDLHAWAKVYSASDINKYTPFTTTMSFCNATFTDTDNPNGAPRLRTAQGVFSEWGSTASQQCVWQTGSKPSNGNSNWFDIPNQTTAKGGSYTVRVQVCDPGSSFRESFCQSYNNSGTPSYKPVGLLQRYGENGQMRFGLITGSYGDPRSGGVLRRNIGKLAGNVANTDCGTGDEVSLQTGVFCSGALASGAEGVVNTLNRFNIVNNIGSWNGTWSDCNTYGINNRTGGNGHLNDPGAASVSGSTAYSCEAWGNPLSEMYAEALNYIAGGASTATYLPGTDLTGLPSATWFDPYGKDSNGNVRNPYCAQCSIIVLSTGLNSFDGDEVSGVTIPNLSATVANDSTRTVGTLEGINGTYLVGRSLDNLVATQSVTAGPAQTGDASVVGNAANTHEDICTGKTVDDLSLVRGICPDIPSQEGSYLIAGLAYKARITDMRPTLKTASGADKPSGNPNNIQTYTVALAENLPKFQIPLSNGSFTIVPLCQANNTGSATASSSDWRNCYLGNVTIGTKTSIISPLYVYGRPQLSSGKAGSFSVVWEDSQWGNDHDLDTEVMFTYCVGAQCSLTTTNHGSYAGYDICWNSTSTVCGTNGKPAVGEDTGLVRIEHLSAYAGNAMLGGFTVTGSDNDGVKRDLLRPGNQDNSILTQSKNIPSTWTTPLVYQFKVGSAQVKSLQNPLYYAAKYGGFAATTDANGNAINQPCDSTTTPACSTSNWDRVDNNTGQPTAAGTGDGLPDNFFPVRNPAQLGARLADVFNKILARSGSGTSAAVVSSSAAGEGLTYQALYQAQQQNKDGSQKVAWTGSLNALWTDAQGRLRMGGYNVNGVPTLGNYTQNPIVVFCTTTTGESRYQTFTDLASAPSSIAPAQCAGQTLDTLTPVWSAQTQLDAGTYTTATQRTYGTAATASNGRYIFTWVDANHNGKVDAGEQMDFTWTTSTLNGTGTCAGTTFTGNYRFLNTCDATGASALVAWVRGADYVGSDGKPDPNWRSRTLDTQIYRLGDIINSTPLAVGTPAEAFDLLYNDASYGGFRSIYQSRRQMIYVGANDGMLHAFNGGFYDAANKQVDLQPPKCASDGTCSADTGYTAHPLGAEVWAYVPGNLLPHLRWMADPQYTHMFYVDGSPISQDARIFSADTGCVASGTSQCHPDGWGTVLIVPFRFGGGPIGLDTKLGSGSVTQQNSFSAYVVLDVTNPEAPPVVLAELTNTSAVGTTCASTVVSCADLTQLAATYTSSLPAVAMFRPSGTTNPNPSKFYLFTGSGTTDNSGVGTTEGGSAGSTRNLLIRGYDMANLAGADPTPVTWGGSTNPLALDFGDVGTAKAGAQSFAGDLIASDFNLDGIAEALYFGSSQGTSNSFNGGMWAIDFNSSTDPTAWTPRMLVSGVNRPVTIRPTLGVDDQQRSMVFFGTGRAYTKADLGDQQQQIIASIIDSKSTIALSALIDITNVQITADDKVVGSPKTVANEAAFAQLVATYPGWLYNLSVQDSNGNTVPAERVISSQALAGGVLLTTTYLPGTDTCTDQGQGLLYGMDYKSGTSSTGLLGFLGTTTSGTSTYVARSVSLGAGLPSQPSLHKGGTDANGTQQLRVCVQTSSGAIICHDVTPLQGITSGEISWREPLDK